MAPKEKEMFHTLEDRLCRRLLWFNCGEDCSENMYISRTTWSFLTLQAKIKSLSNNGGCQCF